MQAAIQHLFHLPEPPSPPDVADALAIAVCCGLELATRPREPATVKAQADEGEDDA
jgi:Holliday junction resolvasome RuvABC endonuclease subunit